MIRRISYFFENTSTPTQRGSRFRNGDRPPELTFRDLTDSIFFRAESSSRAKLSEDTSIEKEQGVVVLSTDTQAKSNAEQLEDRSLVVQPHQLPTVVGGLQPIGDYSVEGDLKPIFNIGPNDTETRNEFEVSLDTEFVTWLEEKLETGLDWSQDLMDTTPVLGEKGYGYTAEGSVVSRLMLPTIAESNDRIGASSNETSSMEVTIEGSGDTFFVVGAGQSVIFRYDISLNSWMIESSHTPFEQTSSTTVYVDTFAALGGDGSITLPFNHILQARDHIIGTGTASNPQIAGATIISVAGISDVNDENLFIEGCTYVFQNNSGCLHTGSGYLFDNSIANNTSRFYVRGDMNYTTTSLNCGIVRSVGNNISGDNSTIFRQIDIEFNNAINSAPFPPIASDTYNVPMVQCYCESGGNNNSNTSLILKGNLIAANRPLYLVEYKDNARVVHECDMTLNFTSQSAGGNELKIRIRQLAYINNVYGVTFNNTNFYAPQVSKYIYIGGETMYINFNNCTFQLYGGVNSFYMLNNCIQIAEDYVPTNKSGSSTIFGIWFDSCSTSSGNYMLADSHNINSPMFAYFIFRVDGSNNPLAYDVDFKDCNFDGRFTTFNLRSRRGTTGSFTYYSPFRSNVLGYINGPVLDKSLLYHNLPSSSVNLPSGAVWNNSGVLSVK